MSRKLEGNGLWDTSRMIVPQHREAIIKYQGEANKRSRPILDSQEYDLISAAIGESFTDERDITLILFDNYSELEISEIVVSVDQHQGRLKIKESDDVVQSIYIRDIIGTK